MELDHVFELGLKFFEFEKNCQNKSHRVLNFEEPGSNLHSKKQPNHFLSVKTKTKGSLKWKN
jgi:hypothetical protein